MLYRQKLTSTLEAFSALCEREGLRWYLAFGSAIGAVRHGGIIPWDDDIDVYMPRPDFEKLLCAKVPVGYEILTPRKVSGLPFTYAKFSDTGSSIWEMKKYPFVTGVFIDVFPLDSVREDKAEGLRKTFIKRLIAYKRGVRRTDFASWCHASLHDRLAAVQDLIWYRPLKNRSLSRLLALESALSKEEGDRFIVYDNIYPLGKVLYDKSLFAGTREVTFEGLKAKLPCGNDALLTQIYGDYMTPPPADKRVSGHHCHFINLEKRLSIPEIKKLLRNQVK